jgi:hypothetical protein
MELFVCLEESYTVYLNLIDGTFTAIFADGTKKHAQRLTALRNICTPKTDADVMYVNPNAIFAERLTLIHTEDGFVDKDTGEKEDRLEHIVVFQEETWDMYLDFCQKRNTIERTYQADVRTLLEQWQTWTQTIPLFVQKRHKP